jgi:hypothetical protein
MTKSGGFVNWLKFTAVCVPGEGPPSLAFRVIVPWRSESVVSGA